MCAQTACFARTQWFGKTHARVQGGIELMCVHHVILVFFFRFGSNCCITKLIFQNENNFLMKMLKVVYIEVKLK